MTIVFSILTSIHLLRFFNGLNIIYSILTNTLIILKVTYSKRYYQMFSYLDIFRIL